MSATWVETERFRGEYWIARCPDCDPRVTAADIPTSFDLAPCLGCAESAERAERMEALR